MEDIQNKLLGALIGLARATDGNEHLISASSTAVVVQCLRATEPSQMEALLHKVGEEKRKMVPDCFLCASPCGRTSDYDLRRLADAEPEVRELKNQILAEIRRAAVIPSSKEHEYALYRGLIALGIEEFTPEYLLPLLQEIHNVTAIG